MRKSKSVTDEEIISACACSNFMSEACVKTGLHKNTFIRRAKSLGVYAPASQTDISKKGGAAFKNNNGYLLEDILAGKYPQYPTSHLSKRLVKEGYLTYECSICGIKTWNGEKISLELDHINGIRHDHRLDNLRLLCPNCHSQTPTFKSKNIGRLPESG